MCEWTQSRHRGIQRDTEGHRGTQRDTEWIQSGYRVDTEGHRGIQELTYITLLVMSLYQYTHTLVDYSIVIVIIVSLYSIISIITKKLSSR